MHRRLLSFTLGEVGVSSTDIRSTTISFRSGLFCRSPPLPPASSAVDLQQIADLISVALFFIEA